MSQSENKSEKNLNHSPNGPSKEHLIDRIQRIRDQRNMTTQPLTISERIEKIREHIRLIHSTPSK